MLFNSLEFILIFLPIVLLFAMRVRGQRLLVWLTSASYFFYSLVGSPWFLFPMLFTTVLDYYLALAIANSKRQGWRKFYFGLSLTSSLGLLCFFKYSRFLYSTGLSAAQFLGLSAAGLGDGQLGFLAEIALPAGISFYTFQTISYIVDVYSGVAEAESNFWRFAGFVVFFPHLVAGPLTRHNQLIPGLKRIEQTGVEPDWENGIFLFTVGLFKKVAIADQIATHIDPLILSLPTAGAAVSWIALLGFSLQLYFDFSGYSDMAIGMARLFSIELPQNFNSPYKATNPSDFWSRWHITLTAWIKDYVYTPSALFALRRSNALLPIAIVGTMLLTGLWHGASWVFAIFGLYHGFWLAIYHRFSRPWKAAPVLVQRAFTFLVVSVGWVFFRSDSFAMVRTWYKGLLGFKGISWAQLTASQLMELFPLMIVSAIIVFALPNASTFHGFKKLEAKYQVILGLAFVLALLLINGSSKFVYYQF